MKATRVNLKTESTDEFFDRLRTQAAKLDAGETPPAGITISFEEPAELLNVLSAERVRLLRRAQLGALTLPALASGLRRDVRAVRRDVVLLEKAGLLRTGYRSNPGHGRVKFVEPIARQYTLTATL